MNKKLIPIILRYRILAQRKQRDRMACLLFLYDKYFFFMYFKDLRANGLTLKEYFHEYEEEFIDLHCWEFE